MFHKNEYFVQNNDSNYGSDSVLRNSYILLNLIYYFFEVDITTPILQMRLRDEKLASYHTVSKG